MHWAYVVCKLTTGAHTKHIKYRNEEIQLKPFARIANPRDLRKKLGINQIEFWSRIGVTQSGGSRYESGRSMPKPVRELLRLVYVKQVPLASADGVDMRIAEQLKQTKPALYKSLRERLAKSK